MPRRTVPPEHHAELSRRVREAAAAVRRVWQGWPGRSPLSTVEVDRLRTIEKRLARIVRDREDALTEAEAAR